MPDSEGRVKPASRGHVGLTEGADLGTYGLPAGMVTEGRRVFDLDDWLLALLTVGVVFGAWSVWRIRRSRDHRHAARARGVFLVTLVGLGLGTLVAVTWAARCLVPFGLAAGWLVIAVLWENPFRAWQEG